jgi:protein-tyrosine phosphatase
MSVLSSIIDNKLYIGDHSYSDGSIELDTTYSIVNCTKNLPFAYPNNSNIRVPIDDIDDLENNNILLSHLTATCDFISGEIKNGNKVLIHCQQGLSRSPSVAVAFLIRDMQMSLDEAINLVQTRRRGALIFSMNFKACLSAWEKLCQK